MKKFDEKKTHNMLTLMLEPKFKSLRLVSSFINHDQGIIIVEQCDTMSLYPTFMKCYLHFHPLIKYDNGFTN